jgi:hypothetical protein
VRLVSGLRNVKKLCIPGSIQRSRHDLLPPRTLKPLRTNTDGSSNPQGNSRYRDGMDVTGTGILQPDFGDKSCRGCLVVSFTDIKLRSYVTSAPV